MGFTYYDSNTLEHHGIPGMHWGQRRYQNEDGSLTAAGRARYGSGEGEGRKRSSARKMQRDFNNLDKGYANVAAENAAAYKKLGKLATKMEKRAKKKGYTLDDAKRSNEDLNDKKITRLTEKAKKAKLKINKTEQQMKSIENLQWRILGKAHDEGYTSSTKAVLRNGTTKKGRAIAAATHLLVGGAVGGAIAGGALASTNKVVQGQKAKIRKNGDGSTRIGTYNGKPIPGPSKYEAIGRAIDDYGKKQAAANAAKTEHNKKKKHGH